MTWQFFQVTYELHSPLHIGYHKIGNLQRTRYYIPARNLWAAVTECLTRAGFAEKELKQRADNYEAVGDWVKEHFAFGYWFVCENNTLLYPQYTSDGLHYGTLSTSDFERRYLSSHVTTAMDAATTSAETGSLHEVEFIAPHTRNGSRTKIGGWICLDETACALFGNEEKWHAWLNNLQVGGERRYGFGRMSFTKFKREGATCWQLDARRPCIHIKKEEPLLAHTLVQGVRAQGPIEPLVGRETSQNSQFFGMILTRAKLCWSPGSILLDDVVFQVEKDGYWIVADRKE